MGTFGTFDRGGTPTSAETYLPSKNPSFLHPCRKRNGLQRYWRNGLSATLGCLDCDGGSNVWPSTHARAYVHASRFRLFGNNVHQNLADFSGTSSDRVPLF